MNDCERMDEDFPESEQEGATAAARDDYGKVLDDVWRRTISAIPSEVGKLAYLSSLRDPNSGQYNHYGLEALYSAEDADRALRQTHINVFYAWLSRSLADQKDDVEHYFRTVEGDLDVIVDNWRDLQPYRGFIPVESDTAGRQLFLSDLGIILDLLASEFYPHLQDPAS